MIIIVSGGQGYVRVAHAVVYILRRPTLQQRRQQLKSEAGNRAHSSRWHVDYFTTGVGIGTEDCS